MIDNQLSTFVSAAILTFLSLFSKPKRDKHITRHSHLSIAHTDILFVTICLMQYQKCTYFIMFLLQLRAESSSNTISHYLTIDQFVLKH